MYTTRSLSLYKNTPEAISIPPEGLNSGYLVLQDEESTPTCCFGLCKNPAINNLPFPQNKRLSIEFHVHSDNGGYHSYNEVYLIPVINQPLSSNRYYAIKSDGRKSKGKAYASSREEDKSTCCFCIPCIHDVKPQPFDSENIYQQFEFYVTKSCGRNILKAKSVAPDGHPPLFLRRSGWNMNAKSLKNCTLEEAHGVDSTLRAHLPDFGFPLSQECSKSVIVGKWYCPFMFIKEGTEKDQIKQSVFYEMTLEQRWERIFSAEKNFTEGKVVTIDVMVSTEMIRLAGKDAVKDERNDDKGVVWFKTKDARGADERVGMSSLIVERMMWEEERVGFIREKDKQVRVHKHEEYQGILDWRSYGSYVLVETFVLKRNDGSVVLTYDFKHTHQLRSKWE